MTDLISVFLTADPFSLRFPYIFRLLNFYFDTEYYAILMSNSFTLIHFRTLARPLQFLLFAFHSKQIDMMIYFYFYVFENNDSNPSFHEEQLPAIENDLSFLITSFQTWSHEEQHGSKSPVVKILKNTNGLTIHRRRYDNNVLHNFVRLLTYKHFITWKPLSLSDAIYHY